MPWSELHYLPLAVFVLLPATFIISYITAILLGHVEVEFPYISDTGTHVPESNFFAQSLNMVAALVAVVIYIRFKQVEQYYRDDLTTQSSKIFRINRWAVFFGFCSALGLSVVANFREIELFKIHLFGAMLTFGCGALYCWLQTTLSFYMEPLVNTVRMAYWRMFLSVLITVNFLTTCVMGQVSIHHFHGKDPTNWQPEDGGYTTHIVSTIAEWIAAMSLDFFILSFTQEFQTFSVQTPRISLNHIEQYDILHTSQDGHTRSISEQTGSFGVDLTINSGQIMH